METSTHGVTAPSAVYEIVGRRFTTASCGFADAIADAHAAHQRPRCMCLAEGIEMYVARLGGSNGGYIVKRMPDTGSHHAPDCPSYEPPAELSGLGQVLGSAIAEDPTTGETTLKLDFPLTKMPGRSRMPTADREGDSVASDGTRLSLRGLLHYLWDQAGLTRWHPGFAGKRTWSTVRKHLLQAAEHKIAKGDPLRSRLYIPEVFSVEHRDAIDARRRAQWIHAVAAPGKPQQLLLMIAEAKEIAPARYGFKAIVKHIPELAFVLDEQLYRRMGRRFETELSMWGASDQLRMVMIATVAQNRSGTATITELSLMPVTNQWLSVEHALDLELVECLTREGRSFVKALRYNLRPGRSLANAILTDTPHSPTPLFIVPLGVERERSVSVYPETAPNMSDSWVWYAAHGARPPLPPR